MESRCRQNFALTTKPQGAIMAVFQAKTQGKHFSIELPPCSFMRKGASQYSPCAAPSYPILFTSGQSPRSSMSPVAGSTFGKNQGISKLRLMRLISHDSLELVNTLL